MDNLSLPLVLEEAGPPHATLQLVIVMTALVFGLVVWGAVTQVGQVAVASGQAVPGRPVQAVQHLEGGIVAEILVEEGSLVMAGQTLLRLESASAAADREELRAREATLSFQVERLSAYVEDRDPDFIDDLNFENLRADQQELLAKQRAADVSRRAVLLAQFDLRRIEEAGLSERRGSFEAEVSILREQLEIREKLHEKGLTSRLVVLEARRAVVSAEEEVQEIRSAGAQAHEAVREAESRFVEFEATKEADALSEMAVAAAELAVVREAIAKLSDRLVRLVVTAPASGVVQGLAVETVGGVVAPGQPLMEIVPVGQDVVVEVRVNPKDIGHVEIGDPASVKVSAFDVARLGGVEGRISKLSPTTFVDEHGEPYFSAQIQLDRNYVGEDPGKNLILPGMVVTADVQTGSRSILQYLAGPIFRTLSRALHER